MDSIVFRAALRASAKVALTAMFGCGGAVQSTSDESRDGAWPPEDSMASIADASNAPLVDVRSPYQGTGASADTEAAAVLDVAAPPPGNCDPPAPGDLLPHSTHPDAGVSDSLFDCCVALLRADFELDASVAGTLTDAQAHDPATLGCCAVVVSRLDSTFGGNAQVSALDELSDAGVDTFACCPPLGYPTGPTCIPWGPPVPPAMTKTEMA
jgi:hypothetical protein